jgi:hypothetical protein
MHIVLLLGLGFLQTGAPDSFSVQAELQGLYDEISQATLQFVTEADVDQFHDVLYTPDWSFVDAAGQRQLWPQAREQAMQSLHGPRLDSMAQPIQKLSLVPGGATVVVNLTTVRTIVDNEGRYGKKGAAHTLTETTEFRDTWVRVSEAWKLQSRAQVGQPKMHVGKPAY